MNRPPCLTSQGCGRQVDDGFRLVCPSGFMLRDLLVVSITVRDGTGASVDGAGDGFVLVMEPLALTVAGFVSTFAVVWGASAFA